MKTPAAKKKATSPARRRKKSSSQGPPKPPKRILVPTDFSEPSKRAITYAVALAAKFSGRVSLIHIEPSAWPADVDTLPLIIKRRNYLDAAQAWLEKFRDKALPPTQRGDVFVATGTPYSEVVRHAQANATDLIVVATHGYTGLKHMLLGSTAEHLVRHARCPVLTIRQVDRRRTAKPEIRKILVPTDFSDYSRRSLEQAVEWAKHLDAKIILLHVLELPAYPQYGYARIPTEEGKRKTIANRQLTELKSALGENLIETITLRTGSPFHEIATEAKVRKSDLVVISTHGYTGFKHLLLGSTAERVVRCAPCPVLVTRTPG